MVRPLFAPLLALLLLGAAPLACGGEAPLVEVAAIPADHLEVTRGDRRLADTTVEALHELPTESRESRGTRYAGVLLRDLLRAHGVDPASVQGVEALAADGYAIQLSGDEVRSDATLVAYEADGDALRKESGPLRLVTEERDHSVRQLRRLRVL
ncbi:MAG: molybdopterin-dependent oxidoreductase [Nannocystaceae bacterium]